MAIDKDTLSKRIDDLLIKASSQVDGSFSSEVYFGAISLVKILYGEDSPQLRSLTDGKKGIESSKLIYFAQTKAINALALGVLNCLKAELELDLISTIEKQATGELFGDFIYMAKESIDNGYKDVAAVLASAAIEDALKKTGKIHGVDLDDKEMSEVINSLKSKGLLKGPQAKILSSYVKVRNKAFHAEWTKIDSPEVKSLIAFTEEYIIKQFS